MNAISTSAVVPGNRRTPSHDPLSLRSRVVEILAGTANGCLTELGYYPGMPQRLQELERQNAKWQSENVKLFQDNRNLTRALQEQNDPKYLNTIRALEAQVQGLSHEKSRLVQQNETLLASQPIAYQKLASAHQRLQDFYAAALREISRLRNDVEVLSGRGPAQQAYVTQVAGQEAVRSSSVLPSEQSPQVPQTLQSQIPFLSSQEPPVVSWSIASGTPIVPSQQPGRQIVEEQAHVKVQTPFGSSAQQALSLVSDWRIRNPISHAERPNSRSNLRKSQSRSVSRPGSSVGTSSRASLQPTLLVKTSPVPPETGSSHLHLTSMNPVTLSQCRSVPSAPPPESKFFANTELLPSPTGTTNVPAAAPLPATPPSPVSLPTQLHSNTTTTSLSGALTQRDINVEPSTSTHCEVPRESGLTSEQIHVDSDHSHASLCPAEPIEAMTPMDVTIEVSPVISFAPSSMPEQESLKRTNSAISAADEEQQHKKQRLDEQKQSDNAEKRTTGTDEDIIDVGRDEDEGSEDGGVEIGPDGLRTVEDCIAALVEDDEDNEELQTCKLCIMRFRLGASTDEPKLFLRATTEEFVQHYTSEHSAAWDKIRRDV